MNKDQFFAAARRQNVVFMLDGVGEVGINALTIAQREELPTRLSTSPAEALEWIVTVAVDGITPDDIDQVREMDPKYIEQIAEAVLELSGLKAGAQDEAKNG